MPTNAEAAETFRAIADLLDVLGERFKPEAYRRAARSIDTLTEDLAAVAARNELRSIPGVGDAIEAKLREFLATGRIDYLERLRREVPPGVAEILHLPGLGPKTARRFWTDLGVEGPAELRAALDAGRLDGQKGFGPKKIAQIRAALDAAAGGPPSARLPIEEAYPIAHRIVRALREGAGADRVEIAGSFRRGRETVGDLDVLVASRDPERAFDVFSTLPDIREVRLRGGTKETAILARGLQVDLRVVDPSSFGAALQYFTGSKEHNVIVRTRARDAGLRVNEYGVFRGETRIAGATEEEVYAALGLAWIPPELREGRGEVDAATAGPLPALVTADDLRGDLHVHLEAAADAAAVERLLEEARRRGLAYLGLVAEGVTAPDGRSASPNRRWRRRCGPRRPASGSSASPRSTRPGRLRVR
ncbi:phosphotransferase domain-containing protein, partial [mine drainage metagenome]